MNQFIHDDKEPNAMDVYRKQNKKYMLSSLIVFGAIVIYVTISGLISGATHIISQVGDDIIGISGSEQSFFVYYDDISSVEMTNTLDPGTFVAGKETDAVYTGTYLNDAYGEYQLYANKATGVFIVIHYSDGVFIFNSDSAKDTEEVYQNLIAAIEEHTKTSTADQ